MVGSATMIGLASCFCLLFVVVMEDGGSGRDPSPPPAYHYRPRPQRQYIHLPHKLSPTPNCPPAPLSPHKFPPTPTRPPPPPPPPLSKSLDNHDHPPPSPQPPSNCTEAAEWRLSTAPGVFFTRYLDVNVVAVEVEENFRIMNAMSKVPIADKDPMKLYHDKEPKQRFQGSKQTLVLSMPSEEAKERTGQLESAVWLFVRRLTLAGLIEGMKGFLKRWSLNGCLIYKAF